MSTESEETKKAAATVATPVTAADEQEEADDREYTNRLRKIGEKGVYDFEFVEGARTGEHVKLSRHKISNRIMLELEEDRADYAAMVMGYRNGKMTKEDRRKAANMLTDLYAKLAKCYFHIERDDFDMMDWDSTKPNIDAAANVSARGRPNLV